MQPQVPQEIARLLRKGEKVLWYGRPVKAALTRTMLPFTLIGIVMVLMSLFMIVPMMMFGSLMGDTGVGGFNFLGPFLIFFVFFIIISIGISVAPFVIASMLANNLHYTVTDQRLLSLGGIFGPGMASTDYDKVQSLDVIVGFFDRSFGTGTVRAALAGVVYTGGGHYRGAGHAFQAVLDPYAVQKLVQDAMDGYNRAKSGMPAAPGPANAQKNKFCRHCGEPIPIDSKFCDHCGKDV